MVDLVKVLEDHCDTLKWSFSYGNVSNNNLLVSDLDADRVYLLLDPVTRLKAKSPFGGDGEVTFNGSFMLLVKSDIDKVYHNQLSVDSSAGKYECSIKPLLEIQLQKLEDLIGCSNYQITNWSIIDTINAGDFNGDGVIVTYSIVTL